MSEASARVKQKTAVINADIESGLSGIRTAKAFANEETELRKFDSSNDTYKTSKRQFHKGHGPVQRRHGIFPVRPVCGGDRGWRRFDHGWKDGYRGSYYLQPLYHDFRQPRSQAFQLCRAVCQWHPPAWDALWS